MILNVCSKTPFKIIVNAQKTMRGRQSFNNSLKICNLINLPCRQRVSRDYQRNSHTSGRGVITNLVQVIRCREGGNKKPHHGLLHGGLLLARQRLLDYTKTPFERTPAARAAVMTVPCQYRATTPRMAEIRLPQG